LRSPAKRNPLPRARRDVRRRTTLSERSGEADNRRNGGVLEAADEVLTSRTLRWCIRARPSGRIRAFVTKARSPCAVTQSQIACCSPGVRRLAWTNLHDFRGIWLIVSGTRPSAFESVTLLMHLHAIPSLTLDMLALTAQSLGVCCIGLEPA
jgi:hypothetical protein